MALRFGLAAVPDASSARSVNALLLSGIDGEELEQALRQPYAGYVELDEGEETPGDPVLAALASHDLYLSLTTATAMGVRGAVLVCDALHGRGVLSKERRANVELCLHEAIANALVHGNMGVSSASKVHPEGFRVFSQLVNDRLRDDRIRRRRVEIFARWDARTLDLGVADQGDGFDTSMLPAEGDDMAPSGRGLRFMRTLATSVSITDGGRCTSLRFPV